MEILSLTKKYAHHVVQISYFVVTNCIYSTMCIVQCAVTVKEI